MPLVGPVGRRRPRARLALAVLYLLLLAGVATTVYPFLIMVSTGTKGVSDQDDNRLVPEYIRDEQALFEKYVHDKYAGNVTLIVSTRVGATAPPETLARYREFLLGLPPEQWLVGFRTPANGIASRLSERYRAWLRRRFGSIDELNRAYVEENVAFQTVAPPNELLERKAWRPSGGRKWNDWLEFKRSLPAEFRIPITEARLYQEYLRAEFANRFDDVPANLRGEATSFETVHTPADRSLLVAFLRDALPPAFADGTIEAKWGLVAAGPLPVEADERDRVLRRAGELRREFATRNYRFVLDYVAVHGRALWNTLILCALAILTQLIVNPLAAYALSRYPMPATGKILVFLLATMAFPAEVTLIPSFLLLKDLGLLNTFAALVLPTVASGFTIYLLKGFFDSLPRELFESGQIDGARETTMLMRIALPLSKPVLGYLALLAFMGAYGAFLYAFLVAQDQRMWTLSVWLYQLQITAPKSAMMAALTVAALPTLIVFLLAQRVIMRGIVLPGER